MAPTVMQFQEPASCANRTLIKRKIIILSHNVLLVAVLHQEVQFGQQEEQAEPNVSSIIRVILLMGLI